MLPYSKTLDTRKIETMDMNQMREFIANMLNDEDPQIKSFAEKIQVLIIREERRRLTQLKNDTIYRNKNREYINQRQREYHQRKKLEKLNSNILG